MPLILIKNNLKLMLRSKWILFMMIIMPVFTIALLSNAFKGMMSTSVSIDPFNAGYRISKESPYEKMLPGLKAVCKDQKITLSQYPEGNIKNLLQDGTVDVFVDIKNDNTYTIYRSDDKDIQATFVESILSSFFYQAGEAAILSQASKTKANTPSLINGTVIKEILPADPVPSSIDYYGIIYIVYFAWCGMISLVAVISSERKSAIPRRMQATPMAKINHYLGKFIPCALAIFIEVCCAGVLSVILLDIHWGRLELSILILLMISLAASALGLLLFQLFNNVAVSIIIGFIYSWVMGYFGGTFEAYRYLSLPKYLINSSPLYYINRTLTEYSTMGHSAYTGRCLLYLAVFIAVLGVAGILLMNRKMEEQ